MQRTLQFFPFLSRLLKSAVYVLTSLPAGGLSRTLSPSGLLKLLLPNTSTVSTLLNPKVRSHSSPSLTCQKHLLRPVRPGDSPGYLHSRLYTSQAGSQDPSASYTHSLCAFTQSQDCKYQLQVRDSQFTSRVWTVLHTPHISNCLLHSSLGNIQKAFQAEDVELRMELIFFRQTCFSLHLPHFTKWPFHCSSHIGQKPGVTLDSFSEMSGLNYLLASLVSTTSNVYPESNTTLLSSLSRISPGIL